MKNSIPLFALTLAAVFAASISAEDEPVKTDKPAQSETPVPAATAPRLPKFPVVSDKFGQIEDDKEMSDDGLPEATSYSRAVLLDIIPALQASTLEHLKANVDKDASFKKIFNHPGDYRGHVVQFEATVKFLFDNSEKVKDANGNVLSIARGHLSSSYQIISFLSVEPLPPGLKKGDAVLLTGVFMQRFAYINKKTPGVELTWTPLIVAKKLEPITLKEEAPPNTAWIVGYVFFSLMAVGLFLAYSSRENRKTMRNNIFRKIKVERTGKDRQFPGP